MHKTGMQKFFVNMLPFLVGWYFFLSIGEYMFYTMTGIRMFVGPTEEARFFLTLGDGVAFIILWGRKEGWFT